MEIYNLVIIGGGCSGLALANALYELNSKKKNFSRRQKERVSI